LPITPHANSFEENHAQIQVLIRDIEAKTNIKASPGTVRGQRNRMDKLQKIINDLREDLQEILNELDAVSPLIREAAMADRSRNIVRSEGKRLVRRLETELSILETKRAELANIINMLEQELSTISNMNQLDMVNLQNASEKASQLYHLLSTVMKNQHEIASAIVRNMI
jgi:chromosome segregation ATPase